MNYTIYDRSSINARISPISLEPLFLTLCFTVPAFSEDAATMHQVYMEFFK